MFFELVNLFLLFATVESSKSYKRRLLFHEVRSALTTVAPIRRIYASLGNSSLFKAYKNIGPLTFGLANTS